MKQGKAYPGWPLVEIDHRLSSRKDTGIFTSRFHRLVILPALAALPVYFMGYLPGELALAILMLGWLFVSGCRSSRRPAADKGRPAMGLILIHSLDTALLIGVGLVCHFFWGLPAKIMLLSVAAALTIYMAYYSGAAFLKAVPSGVRLASPEMMVRVDHLFLSRGTLWGQERTIVLGLSAMGLLAGWPEVGLGLAVAAGNLYWISNSFRFWHRAF